MIYPDDMDKECIPICDALNSIPGIKTIESCCGHNKERFNIFFTAKSFDDLAQIAHINMYTRPTFQNDWRIEVMAVQWVGCTSLAVVFFLSGPPGDYKGANTIANAINRKRK